MAERELNKLQMEVIMAKKRDLGVVVAVASDG
jgi:hypothetical protein